MVDTIMAGAIATAHFITTAVSGPAAGDLAPWADAAEAEGPTVAAVGMAEAGAIDDLPIASRRARKRIHSNQ
jgi:hypothetical protein